MGIRTIFNLLGPLSNPADTQSQLIGVYGQKWVRPLAEVLKNLGSKRALVVHGGDGLDEITITNSTSVAELKDGKVTEFSLEPEQFGFKKCQLGRIRGGNPGFNAQLIREILAGESGPCADIVLFNSGAAIYVGGRAGSIEQGIELARETIISGKASAKLNQLIQCSNQAAQ
jgi:anthranilate phosphoribosyltransferase